MNNLLNKSYAQHLSSHLNELVPGISKGVIGKKEGQVEGIYNQDLANRTISVLAKAVSDLLQEQLNNLVSHAGL